MSLDFVRALKSLINQKKSNSYLNIDYEANNHAFHCDNWNNIALFLNIE